MPNRAEIARVVMKGQSTVFVLMFLAASLAGAQIKVENPQRLQLPEARAQILHHIICRVVAEELQLRGSKTEFAVTLILGEPEERIGIDSDGLPSKIFLKRWDEARFAIADAQLVVQRAVIRDHWQQIANEVTRRWKQVAPVQAGELNRDSSTFR